MEDPRDQTLDGLVHVIEEDMEEINGIEDHWGVIY